MSLIKLYWAYCQAAVGTRIKDERAASLVEYALLLALIAVVCVVAIRFIGTKANDSFNSTGSSF